MRILIPICGIFVRLSRLRGRLFRDGASRVPLWRRAQGVGRHNYGGKRRERGRLVQFVDAREVQEGVQQEVRRYLGRAWVLMQGSGVGRSEEGGGRLVQ